VKLFSILILTIFQITFCYSQNRASTCYFGNVGIDFRTNPPTVINNSAMVAREGPASICDESGNILFYTNGGNSPTSPVQGGIWNFNNELMDNGLLLDSGGCVSSYNGAIIIPFPIGSHQISKELFYVFTRDCLESNFAVSNYNSGLTYSVVDMSLNGGDGRVIEKYNVVVPYSISKVHATAHEPLAAILHGNNAEYWLFSYNNDSLYRLKLGQNGINGYHSYELSKGKITISPARDFLISGSRLYEFNALNGDLIFKTDLGNVSNVAFSPNGSKLYTIEGDFLYQYQLYATDFSNSKTLITEDGMSSNIFLAPNGRVYLFMDNADELAGEIICPNEPGLACGLNMTPLSLNGGSTGNQFTNLMAHYLYQHGINCNVGINEIENNTLPSFHPNPIIDVSSLKFDQPQHFNLSLYTVEGKLVTQLEEKNARYIELNKGDLESGIYFYSLVLEDGTVSQGKVVVQ